MFRSKYFWTHVGLMILAVGLLTGLIFFFLGLYTHHGEKIPISGLNGLQVELAKRQAEEDGFEVVVTDSVFIVGQKGGIVLAQNPEKGTFAKEGRKIYITLSKYMPDMVPIGSLPALYGKNFELKRKVLMEGYEIQSAVVGQLYDAGEPGCILRVIYNYDTIIDARGVRDNISLPKGAKLKFIVSTNQGGQMEVPDLICQEFDEARFSVGNNFELSGRSGTSGKYIVAQEPAYTPGVKIDRGTTIIVDLSDSRPPGCPPDEDE
ncbi:MAG: PASTA domain-containing protein [Saprospiraceae bacterium]|nr:MAG: D-alanine--D-alanine ligase [Candidatus Parvibacillus calidus]MCC7148195.1 PASTA domain-containing protein [Saprospiraceae bacterium]WKZ62141.1 MAG: PASTA domain-containing protein [Saprospiraceae bacterium]